MNGIRETKKQDGYYDKDLDTHIVSVIAGHCNWTRDRNVAFATMLGSCVSVCVYDEDRGIGGMNHFLLPENGGENAGRFTESFRYGSAAIESLLNALYKNGAAKNGLRIKIFGGANVLQRTSNDIGQKNINFTKKFFATENMRIESEDIGGDYGRRIVFFPKTGKVLLRPIGDTSELDDIRNQENAVFEKISNQQDGNDVELF